MRVLLAAVMALAAAGAWAQPAQRPAPPSAAAAPAGETKPMALMVEAVVPLKGPGGPFGAPVADEGGRRLYLPRGPAGVSVLALDGFKPAGDVAGTAGSGAVALDVQAQRGFSIDSLAEGGGTGVTAFDLRTLKPLGQVALAKPVQVLFDAATRTLVVADEDGVLHLVDPMKLEATGTVALEGKRVAGLATDRRGRVFALLADRDSVAVIDMVARRAVAEWKLQPCRVPVALLFEPSIFRLVVACRGTPASPARPAAGNAPATPAAPASPAMALVLDGHGGKPLSNTPVPSLVEGLAGDSQNRILYATSGLNAAAMALKQLDFNRFGIVEIAGTRPLASHGVVDGRTGRLFLPWADSSVSLSGGETPVQRRFQPNGGAVLVMKRMAVE
jgi:hypothetical protein